MLTRGLEAGSWLTQVSREAWWNESMEAVHTGGEGLSSVWGYHVTTGEHILPCPKGQQPLQMWSARDRVHKDPLSWARY